MTATTRVTKTAHGQTRRRLVAAGAAPGGVAPGSPAETAGVDLASPAGTGAGVPSPSSPVVCSVIVVT